MAAVVVEAVKIEENVVETTKEPSIVKKKAVEVAEADLVSYYYCYDSLASAVSDMDASERGMTSCSTDA